MCWRPVSSSRLRCCGTCRRTRCCPPSSCPRGGPASACVPPTTAGTSSTEPRWTSGAGTSDMDAQVLFAGVAVTDVDTVSPWYERLFGRPADIIPNDDEAMWRVTADAGWLYLVADGERAGRSLVAISVADLDAELALLRERGI